MIEHFLQGLLIGFIIAIPIGPNGMLCFLRTKLYGFRTGVFSAVGAIFPIGIYAFVTIYLSMGIVSYFQKKHDLLYLVTGTVFILIGVFIFRSPVSQVNNKPQRVANIKIFSSALFVGLINPKNLFLFTALQLAREQTNPQEILVAMFIIGCLVSASIWYAVVILLALRRSIIEEKLIFWMKKMLGSAFIISGFLKLWIVFE